MLERDRDTLLYELDQTARYYSNVCEHHIASGINKAKQQVEDFLKRIEARDKAALMGQDGTVRICVAVDAQGNWSSAGWSGKKNDSELQSIALEGMSGASLEHTYFVNAPKIIPRQPDSVAGIVEVATDR